jgi:hypothetical protein
MYNYPTLRFILFYFNNIFPSIYRLKIMSEEDEALKKQRLEAYWDRPEKLFD